MLRKNIVKNTFCDFFKIIVYYKNALKISFWEKDDSMTTLKDIAEYTGLSISAVSKSLKNSPEISQATKEYVYKTAVLLKYPLNKYNHVSDSPANASPSARDHIVIMSSDLSSPLYDAFVSYLSQGFAKHNYFTSIEAFNNSVRDLGRLLKVSTITPPKGIVIFSSISEMGDNQIELEKLEELSTILQKEHKTPIIFIGCCPINGVDSLIYDSRRTFSVLQEHLKQMGHNSIAYIGDRFCHSDAELFRETIDKKILHSVNISEAESPEAAGYECMEQVLSKKKYPTAVIAGYDRIATGIYRSISDHHMSIPRDFSVVGSDDSPLAEYMIPRLSSLRYNYEQISEQIMALLLGKIANPDFSITQLIQIEGQLVPRESLGKRVNEQ